MNILVTGATGFIGRHLVFKLAKNNHKISCTVRQTSNIAPFKNLKINFIDADIADYNCLNNINEKFDVIFHCAGFVGNKNKEMLYKVNVLGTQNICELALKLAVSKIVYLSSVSVVSGNPQVPLTEELPYKATNIYGESKIEAEKMAIKYRKRGLKIVILRPCMVYGEDEPHLMKILVSLLRYRLFPIIKGGTNKFHLVYVENVIDAMLYSLVSDGFLNGTFFVADKEVLTTKEVMTVMAAAIGAKPPFELPRLFNPLLLNFPYLGKRARFFLKDRAYSIEKLVSLGFSYHYSAKDALIRSCRLMPQQLKSRWGRF